MAVQLGNAALENRLLQFHARGYFMNAICCYMAMGDEVRLGGRLPLPVFMPAGVTDPAGCCSSVGQVAVSQKLDQYRTTDYTFGESRECKFLARLLEVRHPAALKRHVST